MIPFLGVLSALVATQATGAALGVPTHPLSQFAMKKAEFLIRDRLPCLGCHQLDGEGGRVGPNLGDLNGRRPLDYVYRMISDPQHTVPGTVMPRVPMSSETLDIVARYVVQRQAAAPAGAATLVAVRTGDTSGTAAALYGRLCAVCHGVQGAGDGPNARFLPVPPTAHRDSAYMATRSDDALFDTIFAGGYVMNRSNRMPPFGATLSREQIHGLVLYLRTLCRCQGPAWSRHQ